MRRALHIAVAFLALAVAAPATSAAATSAWSLSPAGHDFGAIEPDGVPTTPAPFTLTNSGETPLPLPLISTSYGYNGDEGEPPAEFTYRDLVCEEVPIPSGGTCTFQAEFVAYAPGAREATLTVEDPGVATVTATLLGTGIGPVVKLSPPLLELPSRLVGIELNPAGVLTLTNAGDADLDLNGIGFPLVGTNPNGFRVSGGTCAVGGVVPGGGSCTIWVSYLPTQIGTLDAELQILDNAYKGEQRQPVQGVGASNVSTLPQSTALIAWPPPKSRRTWARFRFEVSEHVVGFVCRMDAGEWSACASGRTYHHLKPGRHVFRVKPALAYAGVYPTAAVDRFHVLRRKRPAHPSGASDPSARRL